MKKKKKSFGATVPKEENGFRVFDDKGQPVYGVIHEDGLPLKEAQRLAEGLDPKIGPHVRALTEEAQTKAQEQGQTVPLHEVSQDSSNGRAAA